MSCLSKLARLKARALQNTTDADVMSESSLETRNHRILLLILVPQIQWTSTGSQLTAQEYIPGQFYFLTAASQFTTTVSGGPSLLVPPPVAIRKRFPSELGA